LISYSRWKWGRASALSPRRPVRAHPLEGDRISVITRFGGAALLPNFGLPATVELV
jgi:hypothetical protein